MKRSERDAWVSALRSGKYQQGVGFLKRLVNNQECYCCLGVLCDLDGVDWQPCNMGVGAYQFVEQDEGTQGIGIRWYGSIGVRRSNRLGISNDLLGILIHMNDNGRSFAEIADWIEAHVPVEEG